MSSSFGISPVSGSPRPVRSYGTSHLLVLGVIDLLTGVGDLVVASAAPRNRLPLLVLGVLSVVAAVVLLVRPGLAVVTVAVIAGIAFLVRGAGEIGLGLMARRSTR